MTRLCVVGRLRAWSRLLRVARGTGAAAVRVHHVAAAGVHLANLWGEAVAGEGCTAGGCCEGEAFHR
jgi:hypothetical protein